MRLRDRSNIGPPSRYDEESSPIRPGRPVDNRPPFDPEDARHCAFPSLPLDYPGLGPSEQYRMERDQRRRDEAAAEAAKEAEEAEAAAKAAQEATEAEAAGEVVDENDAEDDDVRSGLGDYGVADEWVAGWSVWRTPWPRAADQVQPHQWVLDSHGLDFPFHLEGMDPLYTWGIGERGANAQEQGEQPEPAGDDTRVGLRGQSVQEEDQNFQSGNHTKNKRVAFAPTITSSSSSSSSPPSPSSSSSDDQPEEHYPDSEDDKDFTMAKPRGKGRGGNSKDAATPKPRKSRRFECDQCDKDYDRRERLEAHIKREHPEQADQPEEATTTTNTPKRLVLKRKAEAIPATEPKQPNKRASRADPRRAPTLASPSPEPRQPNKRASRPDPRRAPTLASPEPRSRARPRPYHETNDPDELSLFAPNVMPSLIRGAAPSTAPLARRPFFEQDYSYQLAGGLPPSHGLAARRQWKPLAEGLTPPPPTETATETETEAAPAPDPVARRRIMSIDNLLNEEPARGATDETTAGTAEETEDDVLDEPRRLMFDDGEFL